MSQTNRTDRASPATSLRRSLSLPVITLYGLGTILGAGIYVLIGEVASVAQTFAPFAFVFAAVIAGFTALTCVKWAYGGPTHEARLSVRAAPNHPLQADRCHSGNCDPACNGAWIPAISPECANAPETATRR